MEIKIRNKLKELNEAEKRINKLSEKLQKAEKLQKHSKIRQLITEMLNTAKIKTSFIIESIKKITKMKINNEEYKHILREELEKENRNIHSILNETENLLKEKNK